MSSAICARRESLRTATSVFSVGITTYARIASILAIIPIT